MRGNVISAAQRARRKKQYLEGQVSDIELSDQDMVSIEDITEAYHKDILKFYNVPVLVWTVGILFVLAGLYLIYNLIWGVEGKVFGKKQTWWSWFISLLLIFLGFLFAFAAKREKIVFCKKRDVVFVCLKNIFCKQIISSHKISDIINI